MLKEGQVGISHGAAKDMDVQVGDTIYWHIYSENDWHEAEIGVIYQSPDTQGITYLRSDYEKAGKAFTPSIIAANKDTGSYENNRYITSILSKKEMKEAFDSSYESVNLMVGVMMLFSVIMIVVVLYNSGNLSYHERVKEFATLKVMGLSSSQIRSLITIENIWVMVIGIIAGAPFGRASLESMMNSNGDNFDYIIQVPLWNYAVSAALVMIVTLLIGFMFSGRIKKLDMVEVLKGVE